MTRSSANSLMPGRVSVGALGSGPHRDKTVRGRRVGGHRTMTPEVIVLRIRDAVSVSEDHADPHIWTVGWRRAIRRRLDLGCGTEPSVDPGLALTRVLDDETTFVLVVDGDGPVAHQEVEAVEGAAPAGEHVSPTPGDDLILHRREGRDDRPLEVLLALHIAGDLSLRPDFAEVEAPVVRVPQDPAVHVRVAGVEDEVRRVDPVVIVPVPVRLPGVGVAPVEVHQPAVAGQAVDEAGGIVLAARQASAQTDP